MKKDFNIPPELQSRIIDFLYDVKVESHGWIYREAKDILEKLEKADESSNTSH